MKSVLSYALLTGIAVAGGMAIRDKPKDQTQAWKDYRDRLAHENAIYKAGEAERNKKPEYASIMLDPDEKWMAETRYKYRQKPIPRGLTPIAQEEFDARCAREYRELGFDDRPIRDRYASREIDPYPYQNDNSGLYYQRTIVGDNAGDWSIQFISGPN
jgi:hypothetical protein